MAANPASPASPVALVCGDDEFAVKQRAREIFQNWSSELGGMDHEIIEAAAGNAGEAIKAISKFREALQTLPFFGTGKAVWLRDCNFLGEERTASTADVTEALSSLADELKTFVWGNVRLVVSAGKVDKRKAFYKALDKIGIVESLDAWSVNDKEWVAQAEAWALKTIKGRGKEISEPALSELIECVGPNARQLDSEVEKLCLFAGDRRQIDLSDVKTICSRNKMARAFALGDALGNRNLPALLRCLDEELWEMQFDKDKSEIGLLYGLISKIRALLMLKEMAREGWVKPTNDYSSFKSQLERAPREQLPGDKKYNPLALNPYVLFKALPQTKNYTDTELVTAMDTLLQCNQRLVTSTLDEALVLQQALVMIVGAPRQQHQTPRI